MTGLTYISKYDISRLQLTSGVQIVPSTTLLKSHTPMYGLCLSNGSSTVEFAYVCHE